MTAAPRNGLELFLPRDVLAARIQEMGAEIGSDADGNTLLLIGVLRGPLSFLRTWPAPSLRTLYLILFLSPATEQASILGRTYAWSSI
jgi:hypoxanthine-guanine phosphoribosyltransferase